MIFYRDKNFVNILVDIKNKKILNKNGVIIVHRHKNEKDVLPFNFKIIEEKKYLQQLKEDGYKKDLILKIISLIKKAEFKRKQAPPILKLSSQSLGSDWRVPIAIS